MIRINNAHVLGFEEFEKTLDHIANLQTESGYPPFNIEKKLNKTNEETILNITLAVAGFTADLLEVTVEGRNLRVLGKNADAAPVAGGQPEGALNAPVAGGQSEGALNAPVVGGQSEGALKKDKAEFLHQGIATRQFKKNFILAETIEVASATLKDGLLIIKLRKPEPIKVLRKIPITTA